MSTKFTNTSSIIGKCSKASKLKSNPLVTAAFTLVISLVFFPAFLCTLLIWLPIRLLIVAFVIPAHSNLEPVETGIGTILALRSTGGCPNGNLVYHLICQGDLSLDQLRHQFQHKVLQYTDTKGQTIYRHLRYFFKPFYQVLCWQEDLQFDLNNHIRLYDLTEPELALSQDFVTEEDLMGVTGALTIRPYAPGTSPWELLLIKTFKGKLMMKEAGQEVPDKLSVITSHPIPKHPGGCAIIFSFFGFNPHLHIGPALAQQIGSQIKAANYFNPLPAVMDGMVTLESLLRVFIAKCYADLPLLSTFSWTHYPGPLRELHDPNFATLVDIIPALECMGIGSTAMAVATAGNLRIVLTVNKGVLPRQGEDFSPRLFATAVANELDTLKRAETPCFTCSEFV